MQKTHTRRNNNKPHKNVKRQSSSSATAALKHPEPSQVRGTMRTLLRATNPRILNKTPRAVTRNNATYQSIVNEYRHNMNNDAETAWKNHATAAQLAISLNNTKENAQVLYQSGWMPVRNKETQINKIAKHVGLDLPQNQLKDALEADRSELLKRHHNLFGSDQVFHDIFGGEINKNDQIQANIDSEKALNDMMTQADDAIKSILNKAEMTQKLHANKEMFADISNMQYTDAHNAIMQLEQGIGDSDSELHNIHQLRQHQPHETSKDVV